MTATKSRFVFTFSALVLITLAIAILSFSTQAQASTQYAFAAEGRVYVATVGGDIVDVAVTENGFITALEWSDDGALLAYSLRDATGINALYLEDFSGQAPRLILENVSYMPFEFSDDGTKLYYAPEPPPGEYQFQEGANGAEYLLSVYEYEIATGETRERFVLSLGIGCGGGSPYPMDAAYSTDAGFMGNSLIFEIVGQNIIYSTDCSGVGVIVSSLDGQQLARFDSLARVRLSPDQSALVGVEMARETMTPTQMAIVELGTLEQRIVDNITAPVDQVAWGSDINTIYYSTRTRLESTLELPPQGIELIARRFGDGFNVPRYDVTINRYNRATGESTTIYAGNDWAVGRMFDADGVLYASLVPDGSAWLSAMGSGEINDQTPYPIERTYTLPQVVMLDGGEVPVPLVRGELFAPRPVPSVQG